MFDAICCFHPSVFYVVGGFARQLLRSVAHGSCQVCLLSIVRVRPDAAAIYVWRDRLISLNAICFCCRGSFAQQPLRLVAHGGCQVWLLSMVRVRPDTAAIDFGRGRLLVLNLNFSLCWCFRTAAVAFCCT